MANPAPKGLHTITPRLVVRDPKRLVKFLKDAFQASGNFSPDTPSQIQIGDSIVMISGVGLRDARTAFLYVYVEDADSTYKRALNAGAVSVEEPTDTPYGDRRAMITDPCGNDWQIATHKIDS
jgi:PhnB protein